MASQLWSAATEGATYCKLLEGIAHLNLALARRVDLSGIEEVDAMVPGSLHALLHNVALLCSSIGQPASQREHGDLQTGRSEAAELHVLGIEL
jgi:hypothetical protein